MCLKTPVSKILEDEFRSFIIGCLISRHNWIVKVQVTSGVTLRSIDGFLYIRRVSYYLSEKFRYEDGTYCIKSMLLHNFHLCQT